MGYDVKHVRNHAYSLVYLGMTICLPAVMSVDVNELIDRTSLMYSLMFLYSSEMFSSAIDHNVSPGSIVMLT